MLMVIEGKLSKSTELINYILSLATFLFEHGHFQKKLQIENSIILLQRQFRKVFLSWYHTLYLTVPLFS